MKIKKISAIALSLIIAVAALATPVVIAESGSITPADLGDNVVLHTDLQKQYMDGTTATLKELGSFRTENNKDSYPLPVQFKWTSTISTRSYTLKISEKNDMSNPLTYTSNSTSLSVYNLKVGTKYYWTVSAGSYTSPQASFTTENVAPRNLKIDGVSNCRDLGGWATVNGKRVKQGLIFRTAQLNNDKGIASISDSGKNVMLNELGVKSEIDFRTSSQSGNITVSPLGSGVNYYHRPMLSNGYKNPDMVVKIFKLLADEKNYPIFYHCQAGKDRTGMISFLINALCGVSEADCRLDYLFTNFANVGGVNYTGVDDYLNKIKFNTAGNSFQEKTRNYLLGLNADGDEQLTNAELDKIIQIMTDTSSPVRPTTTTTKKTTTPTGSSASTSSTTTTTTKSTQAPTGNKLLIDWDVNTNYSLVSVTATKPQNSIILSGNATSNRVVNSWSNSFAGYDGITFNLTANSENAATRIKVCVGNDDNKMSFDITGGTQTVTVPFSSLNPISGKDLNLYITGGRIDVTISDIYLYASSSPETTTTTSTSTTTTTTTTTSGTQPIKKGDINGDGEINVIDIQLLLGLVQKGQTGDMRVTDINGDGKVDILDVNALLILVLKG